jgi:hypothetical protein
MGRTDLPREIIVAPENLILAPAVEAQLRVLEQEAFLAVVDELPHPIFQGYQWFTPHNERAFLAHLEGFVIAWRHHLPQQVALYKGQMTDTLAKDMAERVTALNKQKLGYGKLWYDHGAGPPPAKKPFEASIDAASWTFHRLEDFAQFVPLPALRALVVLEAHEIVPDSLWVAEKQEIKRRTTRKQTTTQNQPTSQKQPTPRNLPSPKRLDPVLCASFGRYFVALAEWQ